MIYGVAVILLVLKLICIIQWRKEKNKKELLERKANALLCAIDLSTTSLWIPDLEQTEDCVVISATGFLSDPDEEESYQDFPGISDECEELAQALNE
jgi:hypothetical protein